MYYSHSKFDNQGLTYGSKELKVHIVGVREKALFHFENGLNLGISDAKIKDLVRLICNLHDLGKYTSFFQNYLLKIDPVDRILKRHAQIGGFVAYNLLKDTDKKKALIAIYTIFLHHSALINLSEVSHKININLNEIINRQISDLNDALSSMEEDLSMENISTALHYPDERNLKRDLRHWEKKWVSIQDYFLINYLFSLLIEGDKLDASDTTPYQLKSINPSAVDIRFGTPEKKLHNLETLSNNELRNYCRATVVSHLQNPDILDQFIFTLTAPTGTGKTMTSLDFALKLKSKIKQSEGVGSRIIYGLPFINIIEQALKEYNDTLDNQNVHILGHYQYADIFGDDLQKENDDGAESNYNQKVMALDTWQADIVITSFVQFFETLIGNRNKLLKKFNHFANAIIILDEVQTLRLDHMPLLGASLYYLSKYLRSRIILMTATRPKIFELAQKEILDQRDEKVQPLELLSSYESVFAVFERTSIYSLINSLEDEKDKRSQKFIDKIFHEHWYPEKSCLIVCNTVARSVELYECIEKYLKEREYTNPVYYLSTNIIPAHRMERIEEIKASIAIRKSPILISTQVVEAGVDLDFDMGFRDIGPIDSIIQVAGRINRNNDPERLHAPIYVVDFDPKATQMVYGRLSYSQARKALESQSSFKEEEYLEIINHYFTGISERSSFATSRNYFSSMESLKYSVDGKNDCPVSDFRIIEESNRYAAVFIEIDQAASELLEKYLQKIKNDITKEEFNRDYKLKFQQHIISVPKYLCDDLETVNEHEENILLVPTEQLATKYFRKTGYNRNMQEEDAVFVF